MKIFTDIINEKLRISSKTYTKPIEYKYHPTTRRELRAILEERLKKDKDADLNDIDVSEITDMGCPNSAASLGLFENLNPHNIDISEWNVSKVKDMTYMFYKCKNLNCDLSDWNVSNVEDMRGMFLGCNNFIGEGLENWDVSNVYDMAYMFHNCYKFNCDLNKWNVSKVKDMACLFDECKSLKNKPSWCKK